MSLLARWLAWLEQWEAIYTPPPWLPRWVPSWVNLHGWVYHLTIGTVVTLLGALLRFDAAVALLFLGIGHEWADGDFFSSPGHPWNGCCDILMFVLPAVLWAVLGR